MQNAVRRAGLTLPGVIAALALCTWGALYWGGRGDLARPEGGANGRWSDKTALGSSDVVRKGGDSPAAAVAELWFWTEKSSLPNVLAMYHPRFLSRLGAPEVADFYRHRPGWFAVRRLRVTRTVRRGRRARVAAEIRLQGRVPAIREYSLMRVRDRWLIVGDGVLTRFAPFNAS